VNDLRDEQQEKQYSPISLILSWRMSEESDLHPLKHLKGREVTRGGTVNDLRDEQPEKQYSPISLILS
jgi:hypothetical protein